MTKTAIDSSTDRSGGNIVVLTHNGRLPAEGGKRLGYRALDWRTGQWVYIWLTPPPVIATPPESSEPPKPASPRLSDFRPLSAFGECPNCGTHLLWRVDKIVETSDMGFIGLHKCACGELLR